MSKGWISIHRELKDHWVWNENEPFTKRGAWIDLLLQVNHKEKKVLFNGNLIPVKRGETITSMKKLAEKWGWSIGKVKRYLELLSEDKMIQLDITEKVCTRLTVCNYDTYQDSKTTDGKATENRQKSNGKATEINNNDNNDNNVNNTIYDFDEFWDDYDKKKERAKCERKWKKVKEKDRDLIKKFIPIYKAHQPDKQFRKNPSTFLNNKIWEDDWDSYQPKQSNNGKQSTNDFAKQLEELDELNEIHR